MSVVPFGIINKPKAIKESVIIFQPLGPVALSHRSLTLMDLYCVNPECDCALAHIDVLRHDGEIQGLEPDLAEQKVHQVGEIKYKAAQITEEPVRLELNLDNGAVSFPGNYRAKKTEEEILDQVRQGLTKDHISIFRRHRKEAKAWGNDNYWQYADWSYLKKGIKKGMCVFWNEVFPQVKPWIFKADDADYLAADQYCVNPSCNCTDVIISIHRIHPATFSFFARLRALACRLIGRKAPPEVGHADIIGTVKYNVKTGHRKVDAVERGRHEDLLRLAGSLLRMTDGLSGELNRRYQFMRDFGLHVTKQRQQQAASPATAPQPQRNDPCPCGSGKKYKKCCGQLR